MKNIYKMMNAYPTVGRQPMISAVYYIHSFLAKKY